MSAMMMDVKVKELHGFTKHHSTEDELLPPLLVLLEGCHVQGTSDDV